MSSCWWPGRGVALGAWTTSHLAWVEGVRAEVHGPLGNWAPACVEQRCAGTSSLPGEWGFDVMSRLYWCLPAGSTGSHFGSSGGPQGHMDLG